MSIEALNTLYRVSFCWTTFALLLATAAGFYGTVSARRMGAAPAGPILLAFSVTLLAGTALVFTLFDFVVSEYVDGSVGVILATMAMLMDALGYVGVISGLLLLKLPRSAAVTS